MNKIQKILNEVEKLQNELIKEKKKGNGSDVDNACILKLQNIKNYIKFVQEEPISEDLEEVAKEHRAHGNYGGDINLAMEDSFKLGAKWKEQKMMAKAIDGKVIANGMGKPILHLWDKGKHLIDKKVKVILIKED